MVNRSSILEHVIEPERGNLSSELAKYLLTLNFPQSDQTRYEWLSQRAQTGGLTAEEKAELDDFLNVNDFLTIIQAKARASLD